MKFANPSKKTRTVASLRGHVIEFPGKGTVDAKTAKAEHPHWTVTDDGLVFLHVPSAALPDVREAGLVPLEEYEEPETPAGATRPEDAEKAKELVFDAFRMLKLESKREDFGANGAPKPKALEKLLGWDLNNAEVRDLWNQFQALADD